MRRLLVTLGTAGLVLVGAPAWACGGLVAPNGTVNLLRTTTMAGYHGGVEHYVTAFDFVGAGAAFGSIVPLPDIPTKVRSAGRWTLQRLLQEVQPLVPAPADFALSAESAARAVVIAEYEVEALDITVLKGGGTAVGNWARENGFALSPDAPEVLDFYASRSPIFAAVRFDAQRAARRQVQQGEGTPVHFTIPTDDPWVPLRILALGKQAAEPVEADVFLLTDREPALLLPDQGLTVTRSEPASETLTADLRSDRGMGWIPASGMWLSYLQLETTAGALGYDLAIDVRGGWPSYVDAGLRLPRIRAPGVPATWQLWAGVAGLLATINLAVITARRRTRWV